MKYHVLTLFPEMIRQGTGTSITGRALKNGILSLDAIDIRDFSEDRHRRVDDYTYGGGAGMLMQAEPVYRAWKAAAEGLEGRRVRTIYVTPQGTPFTQRIAEDLAENDDLIFICGHYEGIDERVLEEVVTDYISIGDYVLTGGELAAMVMIDAISRLVPGVLHNEVSAETESFHADLLEYPQYSRPEIWHDRPVPEVLLSGNQKQIDLWRLEQSVARTRERRPDLYRLWQEGQALRRFLMKNKRLHMDMINLIDRGMAERLADPDAEKAKEQDICSVFLRSRRTGHYLYAGEDPRQAPEALRRILGKETDPAGKVLEIHGFLQEGELQAVLTRREKLPVTGLYRPDGKPSSQGLVILKNAEGRLEALLEEEPAGQVQYSEDGQICGLWVAPQFRRRHIGLALETCACNCLLELGVAPWCRLAEGNLPALELQKRLGFYLADGRVSAVKL